jgi:hypothetical protein
MIGTCHHAQAFVEMGFQELPVQGLSVNLDPPISASQASRITGMSHWHPVHGVSLENKR